MTDEQLRYIDGEDKPGIDNRLIALFHDGCHGLYDGLPALIGRMLKSNQQVSRRGLGHDRASNRPALRFDGPFVQLKLAVDRVRVQFHDLPDAPVLRKAKPPLREDQLCDLGEILKVGREPPLLGAHAFKSAERPIDMMEERLS